MTTIRSVFVVSVLVSLAGCGGGFVPVGGSVTLDGKPLAEATVVFQHLSGTPEETIFKGETDSQGKYELVQFGSGTRGARPGPFRVRITTVKLPPDADERTPLPPEPVPPRYRDGSLGFEVPEEGTTEANFHITSR